MFDTENPFSCFKIFLVVPGTGITVACDSKYLQRVAYTEVISILEIIRKVQSKT